MQLNPKTLAVALILIVWIITTAGPSPTSATAAPPPRDAQPELAVAAQPLIAAIQVVLDARDAQLRKLTDGLNSATGSARLALERQIVDLKLQTRCDILNIQIRHARAAGREDLATAYEEQIARLTDPPRAGTPQPRTAPTREVGHE